MIEVLRQWLSSMLYMLHFHDCKIVMCDCI
jgi:hypothetical protein